MFKSGRNEEKAVSYTHLDVYKRQDIDGSVSFTCGYELNEGDFVDVEIFDVNEYDLIGEVI